MSQNRLPCGWAYRLPNFCKGRQCASCILNKDKHKQPAKGGGIAARKGATS